MWQKENAEWSDKANPHGIHLYHKRTGDRRDRVRLSERQSAKLPRRRSGTPTVQVNHKGEAVIFRSRPWYSRKRRDGLRVLITPRSLKKETHIQQTFV